MGGIHVILIPDEVAEHCDNIIVGDAEPVWANMLDELKNGELKKGTMLFSPHARR